MTLVIQMQNALTDTANTTVPVDSGFGGSSFLISSRLESEIVIVTFSSLHSADE